tara:strand:- start:2728 stop:3153 length:426 start_codon:yes stop_codon:yes gene_type:complete
MSNVTEVTITEEVTDIAISNTNAISVNLTPDNTTITVNNFAIPINFMDADNVVFAPYNTITATNVTDALKQLADQNFRSDEPPTGSILGGVSTISEGDTWYDTDDNQLKVYRETSTNVFEWVPIIVGAAADDSDTLDAGAF